MRAERKAEEEFFVQKFMDYFRAEIDENASEISSVTDNPDLAICSQGKVIGVEFSQFPSKYIIENFHKKLPPPKYTKDKIEGELIIYPFEPHRWVHEVLENKHKKVEVYKKRIKADEIWLVMHCHSIKDDWPMSKVSKEGSREAETLLMKFGTRKYQSHFDRLFYIYADGTVVSLKGEGELIPAAVSLPDGDGYPAVTTHRFSFSVDVPLPRLGAREYQFGDIQFDETIIAPLDDWMAGRDPKVARPKFSSIARVDSDRMEWKVFRDGNLILNRVIETSGHRGKTKYAHFLLEWSIQKTTFSTNE